MSICQAFYRSTQTQGCTSCTQEHFIKALSKCVDKQLHDRELLAGEIKKQYDNNTMETLPTRQKSVLPEERDSVLSNGVVDSR